MVIHTPCIGSIQTSTVRSFMENVTDNLNIGFPLSQEMKNKVFHYKKHKSNTIQSQYISCIIITIENKLKKLYL